MRLHRSLLTLWLAVAVTALAQQPAIDPAIAHEIDSTPRSTITRTPCFRRRPTQPIASSTRCPVDNMAPQTDPVACAPTGRALADAWHALFGVDLKPPLNAGTDQATRRRTRERKAREGEHYSAYVLDKSGIGTMVANRVAWGRVSSRRASSGCPMRTRCFSARTTPPWRLTLPTARSFFHSKTSLRSVHRTRRPRQNCRQRWTHYIAQSCCQRCTDSKITARLRPSLSLLSALAVHQAIRRTSRHSDLREIYRHQCITRPRLRTSRSRTTCFA